jgi:hypothetical protein
VKRHHDMPMLVIVLLIMAVVFALLFTSCKPSTSTALGGPEVENHPDKLTVHHGGTMISVVIKGGDETKALIEKLQAELEECRHAQD